MGTRAITITNSAGFLANGLWDLFAIAVPLYAVALSFSATEIGLLVSARAILPAVLALHGGMLMDSFGVRRVLIPLAAANVMLPLIYPLTPWFSALLLLQMFTGLAAALTWSGTQTLINQLSEGEIAPIGRFGFYARLGSMLAPILAGTAWDMAGPWGTFAVVAVWSVLLLAVACALPGSVIPMSNTPNSPVAGVERSCFLEILSWRKYGQALALLAIPMVAFVTALSFLRNAPAAMQAFYIVLLQEAGLIGTTIGLLIAMAELSAGMGSLFAGKLARGMPLPLMAIIGVAAAILLIAVTPLIVGLFAALVVAAILRGLAQGANQPILGAILARETGLPQGVAFGLRTTAHRLSSMLLPALMGGAIEAWGIRAGFYVVGICTIMLCFSCAAFLPHQRLRS